LYIFTIVIFVPELSTSTKGNSASTPTTPDCQDYALLPTPLSVIYTLQPAKRNETDIRRISEMAGDPLLFSQTGKYFISNGYAFFNYDSSFPNIFTKRFRQACQLLNIPPPYSFLK